MSTTPAHGYTEAELALLSDEEREGLLDPNVVDDPEEGTTTAAPEVSTGTTAEAAAAAEPETTTEPAPAGTTEPAPAKAAETPTPDAAIPAAPAPVPRVPDYQAPADVDTKMKDIRSQQEALADKFDAGELTAREYENQRRTLEDNYLDLRDARSRATLSFDAQRATWENETVANFLGEHGAYAEEGSFLYNSLDQQVRRLQVTTYKDDPFNPKILTDAHDNIQNGLSALTGKKPPADDPKPDPATPAPERKVPPSLSNMPTAHEEPLDGGGDFAFLDRLQGVEFEEALGRLTPAQQDAYMSR